MTVLNEDLGFGAYDCLKFEEFLLFLVNCTVFAQSDQLNEEPGLDTVNSVKDSKRNVSVKGTQPLEEKEESN